MRGPGYTSAALPTHRRRLASLVWALFIGSLVGQLAQAQDYEDEPIRYTQTVPANRVSRLEARLASGEVTLPHQRRFGYLPAILRELEIPESSQTLVFSKTSLQRNRISPRTPRAIYFSDDTYVGYCQQGEVLEISTADPALGTVFYTLDQTATEEPRFVRQHDNCLICHASSHTRQVPGHLLRSVFVDASGQPIFSAGSYRVDQTTPFERRWGGWYVTGQHGAQKHLGNHVVKPGETPPQIENSDGMNLTDLGERFDSSRYLTPHSDIVALMVLEHQTQVHNAITQANFLTRQAIHHQDALNRQLGEPADHWWESTTSRIQSACEPLVECLFCCGEPELTSPLRGSSRFASEFAAGGPTDKQGRSLRELGLERRLLKFPCSYLIYSVEMQTLPPAAKEYVWGRVRQILSGEDTSPDFAHLSSADRLAIREILRDTLPEIGPL